MNPAGDKEISNTNYFNIKADLTPRNDSPNCEEDKFDHVALIDRNKKKKHFTNNRSLTIEDIPSN